jgi:hypothetical protein
LEGFEQSQMRQRTGGEMASSLTSTKARCAPLEAGSGRGLTKLLQVVRYIRNRDCQKVQESWLVG